MLTHLSTVTLKSFSESVFQETTTLPIDEQTVCFLLHKHKDMILLLSVLQYNFL